MRLYLPETPIALRENAPLRLTGARGCEVLAVAGIVWITAEGQPGDHFIRAGERFVIATDGLTLVEAIGAASVSLVIPENPLTAPLRRLARRLRAGGKDRMRDGIPPACPDTA